MSSSEGSGVVKWFSPAKGYGFISRTDAKSKRIFFHKSKIVLRYRYHLRKGDTVTFTLKTTKKGLQAYQVAKADQQTKCDDSKKTTKKGLQVTKADRQTGRDDTKKQESSDLTYPYFKQPVPIDLIDKSNQDPLYPTEWVGWLKLSEIIFVQVAYPILPDDFESYEEISNSIQLVYKVFESEDDSEGKDIHRTSLVKLVNKEAAQKGVAVKEQEAALEMKAESASAIRVFSSQISQWVPAGATCDLRLQSVTKTNFKQSERNESVGRTWMKQVETDFQLLQHLQHTCKDCTKSFEWFGTACFLAQQVAEKALTGGICFFNGSDVLTFNRLKDHRLCKRFNALKPHKKIIGKECYKVLESEAKKLEDYYLKPRYPNKWEKNVVPANKYKEPEANAAIASAECIKKIMQASMDKKKR